MIKEKFNWTYDTPYKFFPSSLDLVMSRNFCKNKNLQTENTPVTGCIELSALGKISSNYTIGGL